MSIELPPLPAYHFNLHRCEYRQIEQHHGEQPECYMIADVEARERILLARIAANDNALSWLGELMAVMHADGGQYLAKHGAEKAIGDAMDKYHAMCKRIAELEAVLVDTVAAYGKPGGPWNVPSDPGGWLDRARNAIDAARGRE